MKIERRGSSSLLVAAVTACSFGLYGCLSMPTKVDSLEALGIENSGQAANGAIGDLRDKRVAIVLSPNTKTMVEFDKTVNEKSTAFNDYFAGGAEARAAMHDSKGYIVVLAEMLKTNFPSGRLANTVADAQRVDPASIILVDIFKEARTEGSFGPTAVVTKWQARFDFVTPGSPPRVHRTLEAVVTEKCPPPNWGGSTTYAQCDARTRDQMLGDLRQKLDAAMRGL